MSPGYKGAQLAVPHQLCGGYSGGPLQWMSV